MTDLIKCGRHVTAKEVCQILTKTHDFIPSNTISFCLYKCTWHPTVQSIRQPGPNYRVGIYMFHCMPLLYVRCRQSCIWHSLFWPGVRQIVRCLAKDSHSLASHVCYTTTGNSQMCLSHTWKQVPDDGHYQLTSRILSRLIEADQITLPHQSIWAVLVCAFWNLNYVPAQWWNRHS